jgi:hypothetical protein
LSTPSFFPFSTLIYPTPVTTQPVLPITPNLPEEDIAKALEQLYANLTHFLISHCYTLNTHLSSHQPNGTQPAGILPSPYPALLPSHHHYPCHEDMTSQSLDSYPDPYLPSDIDSSPRIVTLLDLACGLDLVTHYDSPDSSLSNHHDSECYT